MSNTPDLTELIAALPEDALVTNPDSMEAYRRDRAEDPGTGMPAAVAKPGSTEEVQAVVRFAAKHGISVVTRGMGSGLSGGASAIDGCIVLSTERMREVVVDADTQTAIAQAGAVNAKVKRVASEAGLWYPPDPSSFGFCSIGGNVATNAGGLCCVKYGVTGDYVLGLTVVTADGEVVKLGGPRIKDVAGLSLLKLFVGSEGTLGVITEVVLRLVPAQRPATTLVSSFPTLEAATQTVIDIKQKMRPAMLEFMDRVAINAVEDELKMGLDRDAAAMLIVQSDEPGDHAVAEIERIAEICEGNGATETYSTDDPEEGQMFTVARRQAVDCMEKKGPVLLDDVGVPMPKLGELVAGVGRIAAEHDVVISVIAHAGDGNTHPMLVLDPSDPAQQERVWAAYGKVMDLAISLDGTITGEHGVGRLKRQWLPAQLGDGAYALNQKVKQALDPQGILNPGAAL